MQAAQIASLYAAHRPYFFAIAYNMIGEVHEAEDVVQDVFEKVLQGAGSGAADARAYMSRMVINRALDRLEQRKRQRQDYPGPWLPEPFMTEPDAPEGEDILPYAVLCLMEQLNPLERAVLLLREAFDYPYSEIAGLCGIREDHCRQLLHRARVRIARPLKGGRTDETRQKALLQSFLQASFSGDVTALSALLHEDIVLYSDGGGKAAAARKPLLGPVTVAKFFAGFGMHPKAGSVRHSIVSVNGEPALVLWLDGAIISVFMPLVEDGLVSHMYVMRNPDKIFFSPPVTN